jgi:Uma2 family endonuclease
LIARLKSLLDIVNRQLYVFREPNQECYQNKVILGESEIISPLEFPDLQISIWEMLPPVIAAR